MSNRCTHPIGSIGWTEHTGGVLTLREGLSLAGPLIRDAISSYSRESEWPKSAPKGEKRLGSADGS